MRLPALPKGEEAKEPRESPTSARLKAFREIVSKKVSFKKPSFKVPKRK